MEIHDIYKSVADHERLIHDGGKDQVPCLLIEGRPLYESMDIIEWLNVHPQEE